MPMYEVSLKKGDTVRVEAANQPAVVPLRRGQRIYQFVDENMQVVAEYDVEHVSGWRRSPDSPDALEVVIYIIVEFASHRKQQETGSPMTEEEKREYRERSDVKDWARRFMEAASASAVGGTAGNLISGLLGLG